MCPLFHRAQRRPSGYPEEYLWPLGFVRCPACFTESIHGTLRAVGPSTFTRPVVASYLGFHGWQDDERPFFQSRSCALGNRSARAALGSGVSGAGIVIILPTRFAKTVAGSNAARKVPVAGLVKKGGAWARSLSAGMIHEAVSKEIRVEPAVSIQFHGTGTARTAMQTETAPSCPY